MGAITNAIARYGLFLPFCSTFFIFSDYLKPAIRVGALMKNKEFFIFTHDSIGVGEDGATHQPIEQLSTFRAMPDFYTFRPADGIENIVCWEIAFGLDAPCGFVLSRQKLPILDRTKSHGDMKKGGYLVRKEENPTYTLIATGSEVELALKVADTLKEKGIIANVTSILSFELFCEQDKAYQEEIINPQHKRVAIEAASANEWYRFADTVIGMSSFGQSAPADKLFEYFGFSVEDVIKHIG
jgi:transketolase